jgi:hypothetical protein
MPKLLMDKRCPDCHHKETDHDGWGCTWRDCLCSLERIFLLTYFKEGGK